MVCGAEKDHVFLHDPHICSVLPLLDLQAFRIFKLYNISWSSFNIGSVSYTHLPLLIKQIRKDAVLFELASGSGCISEEACRQAGLCRIACPGLPGRFSPKASARILCRAVLQVLGEGR